MDSIFEQTISIVKQAGEIIADRISDTYTIIPKGDSDFVTPVDYEVQEFIVTRLERLIPGSLFLAEEDCHDQYEPSLPLWILDPIDGTTNFLHEYPCVTISLALAQHGTVIFGIVYNPVTKELFHAQQGKGSYLNNERIVVSPNKTLKQCIIGFGLPYDRRKSAFIFKKAQQIFLQCQDLKRKGPASLDIAYVSCGRLDGYFELDLQPWDFAAGILILEEAEGRISDWTGLSLPINRRTNVIASNRHIHELLINAINIQHINKVAGLSAHRIHASYRQS